MDPQPHEVTAAACRGVSPDLFFAPLPTDTPTGWTPEGAYRVCAICPVNIACLEASIARRERFGIWGGVGGELRRRFTRAHRVRTHNDGYRPRCTCLWCVEVRRHLQWLQQWRGEPVAVRTSTPERNGPNVTHGLPATYARGCRCPDCKRGILGHHRARREARRRQDPAA